MTTQTKQDQIKAEREAYIKLFNQYNDVLKSSEFHEEFYSKLKQFDSLAPVNLRLALFTLNQCMEEWGRYVAFEEGQDCQEQW